MVKMNQQVMKAHLILLLSAEQQKNNFTLRGNSTSFNRVEEVASKLMNSEIKLYYDGQYLVCEEISKELPI